VGQIPAVRRARDRNSVVSVTRISGTRSASWIKPPALVRKKYTIPMDSLQGGKMVTRFMTGAPETLNVFSAVIRVVLSDGVLTQEEKRLIITIGRELELDDGDPVKVYEAVVRGEEIDGGREMTRKERVDLYRKSWMTVHFNEDESEDEAAVMKCLREELHFSKDEANAIIEPMREKQREAGGEPPSTFVGKLKNRLRK